ADCESTHRTPRTDLNHRHPFAPPPPPAGEVAEALRRRRGRGGSGPATPPPSHSLRLFDTSPAGGGGGAGCGTGSRAAGERRMGGVNMNTILVVIGSASLVFAALVTLVNLISMKCFTMRAPSGADA